LPQVAKILDIQALFQKLQPHPKQIRPKATLLTLQDDVLIGASLRTRIRDHLSADELNSFFEGDEDMRDDLPFDDEDDELINGIRDLQYQAQNGNVYAMYRLSKIHFDENSNYYHEARGDYYLDRAAGGWLSRSAISHQAMKGLENIPCCHKDGKGYFVRRQTRLVIIQTSSAAYAHHFHYRYIFLLKGGK